MNKPEITPTTGAFTLPEFRERFKLSTGRLYELQQAGLGPEVYYIASRPYVSYRAAQEWQQRMESGAASNFKRLPARNPGRRGKIGNTHHGDQS